MIEWTPFPYLVYYPVRILNGTADGREILRVLADSGGLDCSLMVRSLRAMAARSAPLWSSGRMKIRRYLRLVRIFVLTSISAQLEYRVNFVVNLFDFDCYSRWGGLWPGRAVWRWTTAGRLELSRGADRRGTVHARAGLYRLVPGTQPERHRRSDSHRHDGFQPAQADRRTVPGVGTQRQHVPAHRYGRRHSV